jgi:hypothetical protein
MSAHLQPRHRLASVLAALALGSLASAAQAQGCPDTDRDNIDDCIELLVGTNPAVKDNDVQGNAMLFAMQQFRDFLQREASLAEGQHWGAQIDGGMGRGRMAELLLRSGYNYGVAGPITRLYLAYFLRIPDRDGLGFWIDYARLGWSLAMISDQFAQSAEFQARYGALDNSQFVTLIYQNVLGRAPDSEGHAFWLGELNSGARTRGMVMIGFSESPEYRGLSGAEVDVVLAYFGMLRRTPDPGGFAFWVGYIDAGNAPHQVLEAVAASGEYRARFMP